MEQLHGQTRTAAGVYQLRGVMETASVFELKPDASFNFFFSQGALDRYGQGHWKKAGDSIVFSSRTRPEKDFALVSSSTVPGNDIVIQLAEKNTMILPYTEVTINAGGKLSRQKTDSHGEVHFPKQTLNSIQLLFTICPDRPSNFAISHPEHNYYVFRLEPWIAEVFFEQFSLKVSAEGLTGKHPLLEGRQFTYEKEEH